MWMHSLRTSCWQHRLPSRRCEPQPEFWKQHSRHWQPLRSLSPDWQKRLWKLRLMYWKIVACYFHVGSPCRFKPCLRCKFRKGHHGNLSLCWMVRFVYLEQIVSLIVGFGFFLLLGMVRSSRHKLTECIQNLPVSQISHHLAHSQSPVCNPTKALFSSKNQH